MSTDTKAADPDREALNENLDKVDQLTQRLVLALANRKTQNPELAGPDSELYIKAASAYFAQMMANPARMMEQQVSHFRRSLEYWAEARDQVAGRETPDGPVANDRRFKGELWEQNPWFNMLKQNYLLSAEAIDNTVSGLEGLDEGEHKQVAFFARQIIDLYSPTNYLGTNPEALTKALETNGQSLVDGLENMVRDLERNGGELSVTLSDPDAFEVGTNIATSPGSVVYENRMFQLIQYAPSTEQAHKIPLLIVPPWINKFYILDLKERNSFIKFAVDQGFTVFMVSWVNPDESYRDCGLDTYLNEGLLEAVRQVKAISGERRINAIGYCIGGTLLTIALSWLAQEKDNSIKSATFFTTLTDFEDAGELKVFIDESFLSGIEKEVDERGYLDSAIMSRTFSFLRANDLVYGPAVRSYLMGEAPPAFDLLYWNSDSTNLPARMAKEYLRRLYQNNELSTGRFSINGKLLDMGDIRTPLFVVATRTDHIAPWKSSFRGLAKTRGRKTFVLSGSGHIAGIVNAADSTKYGYVTNPRSPRKPEKWLEEAQEHAGSWWRDWASWLGERSGKMVDARVPGSLDTHPALESAPGSYVKKSHKNN